MPADSQSNPFNMFGSGFGAGAMGNSFGGMDPNMTNQMLQNPMFAQYMSSVLQNPAVLDSIIQTNPQLSGMGPEIRGMMQSPEFRQMLSNPDMIRQMATMASGVQGQQGGAGGNPFASMMGGAAPPQTNTEQQQQQQQQNPFAGFGNVPAVDPQLQQRMAALFGTPGAAPAAPVDTRSPEERFQVQLQQLNEMGFWDAAKNIRALTATGGNVHAAIEMLFSGTI
jgi:ubiquilin